MSNITHRGSSRIVACVWLAALFAAHTARADEGPPMTTPMSSEKTYTLNGGVLGKVVIRLTTADKKPPTLRVECKSFTADVPPEALTGLADANWDQMRIPCYYEDPLDPTTKDPFGRGGALFFIDVGLSTRKPGLSMDAELWFDRTGKFKERKLDASVALKDGRANFETPLRSEGPSTSLQEDWPLNSTLTPEQIIRRAIEKRDR